MFTKEWSKIGIRVNLSKMPCLDFQVSRPRPSDNPLLFLFLVGGVTPSELRLIKDTVSKLKPETQVLILSTRLLRPTDIPKLLFSSQRLRPDIGL
ncbi:Sec1 domain-containing protein 2 [Characodon lateralis]|uniref:Sec1 domain-containing protein 2 n=1 Tax=Characodon lateralis TaxID=208331 RepID=A0ABU7CSA1_9TELE|nr:Sec1 domain-containing protein 2 [Characodon lateralis]